jgi:DNA-binding transcriptional regulator YiaG
MTITAMKIPPVLSCRKQDIPTMISTITGQEIRELREKMLHLTQAEFARILRVSRETIARWENEEQRPLPVFVSAIKRLRRRKLREG